MDANRRLRLAGVLSIVLAGLAARAGAANPVRPLEEQKKIDYLIGEVKRSTATFLRNGAEHTATRAASHLARKLRFAGERVQTARDFIVGIASKSETSGKIYEIRWPGGRRQPLAEWLRSRLAAYEKSRTPAPRR
jgi:uncharacterized protein DUF5329